MPVHLYGQCADMAAIMAVAARHGLRVDRGRGAGDRRGVPRAGAPARIGDFGCFSFFPSKNLGAFGDGGMVVTDDEALARAAARCSASTASEPKYYHTFVGGNFRLDALQAAVLRVKLPHLDAWSAARQRNAALYDASSRGRPRRS